MEGSFVGVAVGGASILAVSIAMSLLIKPKPKPKSAEERPDVVEESSQV